MQLRKIDFLNYFSQGPFSWQGQKGLCTNECVSVFRDLLYKKNVLCMRKFHNRVELRTRNDFSNVNFDFFLNSFSMETYFPGADEFTQKVKNTLRKLMCILHSIFDRRRQYESVHYRNVAKKWQKNQKRTVSSSFSWIKCTGENFNRKILIETSIISLLHANLVHISASQFAIQ